MQSGDTLGKIARNNDTSVEEIQALNGLRGTLININQKLQIPGKGGVSNISIASIAREFVEYPDPTFKPIKLGDEFQLVHQSGSTPEKPLLAVSLNLNMLEAGRRRVEPGADGLQGTAGRYAGSHRAAVRCISQQLARPVTTWMVRRSSRTRS